MTPGDMTREELAASYEEWARKYLKSLPLEHFMEATPRATQRKITLESLDLVAARRGDFHLFNELLVQYPREGKRRPGQVVPDNMVVLHDGPITAVGSYDLPTQPARPFWVLEYVSKSSERKDYEDNFDKYEKELKVPYYLTFYPDNQELSLFRLAGGRYQAVVPQQGRIPIPELDMEVGLLDGWVRFWYQGQLLPLPADLQRALDEARQKLAQAQEQLGQAQEQLGQTQQQLSQAQEQLGQAQQQVVLSEEQINDLQRRLQQEEQRRLDLEALLARLQAGETGPPDAPAP
jgi:Uma2 family endonuclease